MAQIQHQQVTDKNKLIERISTARVKLFKLIYPATQYMPYVIQHKPKYDTEEGKRLIRDAINFRCFDEKVISDLEAVVKNLEDKNNA